MQDIDLQAPPNAVPLQAARCPNALNCVHKIPPAISFRSNPLVGTLSQTAKVMIVDDEPVNIQVVQKHLTLAGYQHFVTSTDPRLVLEMIVQEMPDVILIDITMPRVTGLEILRKVRDDECLAHIPTIVLTASDNEQTKMEALELGATDFLSKPVNAAELVVRVRNALFVKAHHDHLKDDAQELENQVRKRTSELAASRLELIHSLARAAEYRDNETGRHVVRVGRYAEIIARKLGLDAGTVELLGHAAPLHDMGKVGIPDQILLKPGKLAPDEFEVMQKHTTYGKHTFEPMSEEEWRHFKSTRSWWLRFRLGHRHGGVRTFRAGYDNHEEIPGR